MNLNVSVVIVNYNAGGILIDCVSSIIPHVEEVFVVDNFSSDLSMIELAEKFRNEDKLNIIKNYRNLGFSAGCNIGARQSSGDYILFLNPDCVIQPDAISELLNVFICNSDIGMAGGLILNPDGTEQRGCRRDLPTPWLSFVRAFGLHRFSKWWPNVFRDLNLHRQHTPDRSVEVEAISGACMLISREAIVDVGLWDEEYFLHCEDLDYCMRFRIKGWRVMFVPSSLIVHAKSVCSRTRPIFVEWHKHKGMLHFYGKFFRSGYSGLLWVVVTVGVWLRFAIVVANVLVQMVLKRIGIIRE